MSVSKRHLRLELTTALLNTLSENNRVTGLDRKLLDLVNLNTVDHGAMHRTQVLDKESLHIDQPRLCHCERVPDKPLP